MGDKTSTPEQLAKARGQQISAAGWQERIRARQLPPQAQQQFATKRDLNIVQRNLEKRIGHIGQPTAADALKKGGRMIARGLRDINRSMTTPYDPHARPLISQMPERKPPVARGWNKDYLKSPGMRGKSITSGWLRK